MLNDEYPDFGAKSPTSIGGSPVAFHIQVPDADTAVDRAVKAGATLMREVQDEFYGDRSGWSPVRLAIAGPWRQPRSRSAPRRCRSAGPR